MLNTPVCCLVWVNQQLPVHKQECLLGSWELLHQVLLSTVHSVPLGRPRTSLDLSGLGTDIGAAQSTMEPESLTAGRAVVQGMDQDAMYPQLPHCGRSEIIGFSAYALVALKEGQSISITALSCRVRCS